MPQRPVNKHETYHAHIYFDELTQGFALELCEDIAQNFSLQVGRFHRKTVGPHPLWSCQIIFSHRDFDTIVPWLDQHRGELTIFIHGISGDDLKDHTEYAYWLGNSVELNLSIFDKTRQSYEHRK